jgi:hypothetical protein
MPVFQSLRLRPILSGIATGVVLGILLSFASPWVFSLLVADPVPSQLAGGHGPLRLEFLLPRYFSYAVFLGLLHYIPAGYVAAYLADRSFVAHALAVGLVLAALLAGDLVVRDLLRGHSLWLYALLSFEGALAIGLCAFGGKIREIQLGKHRRSGSRLCA